jgi:hypothetical protein
VKLIVRLIVGIVSMSSRHGKKHGCDSQVDSRRNRAREVESTMNTLCRSVLMVCAAWMLVPGIGWAGKPSGGGGTDNTWPAAIPNTQSNPLTVKQSARALTLRFTATGDDGMAGTAAHYDVAYRLSASSDPCTDNPDSGTGWLRAARSDVTIPEPGGTVDYFNVRPLQSSTNYCLAIRARDEVTSPTFHWSAWTSVPGKTTGESGDWPFVAEQPSSPSEPTNSNLYSWRIQLGLGNGGQPVMGWVVLDPNNGPSNYNIVFEKPDSAPSSQDAWQQQVSLATYITGSLESFQLAANPGPTGGAVVSAVVTNHQADASGRGGKNVVTSGTNSYWLVEAGAPLAGVKISSIASGPAAAGGVDWPQANSGSLTYVLNNGAWNPGVTIERVESKGSNGKRTSLRFAERVDVSANNWLEETVLVHQAPDQSDGFFQFVQAFTKPGGMTRGLVAAHCGITVYAQRVGSTWEYYDAGPARSVYRIGFDSTALDSDGEPSAVVLSSAGYPTTGQAFVGRQANFIPLSAMPAAACVDVPPSGAPAWESVNLPTNPDVPWLYVSGIAEVQGATFISASQEEGNGKTDEQRLVYNCHTPTDGDWHVLTVDRTNLTYVRSQPVIADEQGNLLLAYSWSRFARYVGDGPAYTAVPPDRVYLAKHAGNPCGIPGP